MAQTMRFAWYRFGGTLSHRRGGYITIVVLIGILGGLAMGAVAGARRTQSSFPTYLKSTNPSDLIVLHSDSNDDSNATDPAFLRDLAHLPHVKRVRSSTGASELVLGPDGTAGRTGRYALFNSSVSTVSYVDGGFFDQDRPTVIQGRLLNRGHADEMNMSADAARVLDLHVGDVVPFDFYTNQQTLQPDYGTGRQKPRRAIRLKLVGIVAANFEIVRDDFDRTLKTVVFSPALTNPLAKCCLNGPIAGVQLERGAADDAAFEAEVKQSLPGSTVIKIRAVWEASALRAIAPQSIALGAFGAFAALAALLIAGQAIGRHLRAGAGDLEILRALGAGPGMTQIDGAIGVVGAIAVGSLLAGMAAVALSPLAPLGPVRPVYPSRGLAFDWTVLGAGVGVLFVVLGVLASAIAFRQAPLRVARRTRLVKPRSSRVAAAAAASGLPVSGVTGLRLALDPGRDQRAVPLRSAIVGSVLAIVVVISTVIFGASLNSLAAHPALYGWNWDYEMLGAYGGLGEVARPTIGNLLDRDPYVAARSYVSFSNLRIDGKTVPVMGTELKAAVAPPILTGHALDAANQIVLGASTLAQLHKHVGDKVSFNNGVAKPTQLVVAGTATLPAIGQFSSLHLEIGTGAVISEKLIPDADLGFFGRPNRLPQAVLVRLRTGADPTAARRSLQRIASQSPNEDAGPPTVVSVQRPAEIVNYRTMGDTPALLGTALAVGAIAALGLTLFASVRRRRRELALFKTLGFTRRQLAATVAWQASIAVALGVLIGVPVGIITGRVLWNQFAGALHVVPRPTVPTFTITLVAVGALVLANLVAAIPGRQAARTQTAVLLRAE